MILKKYIDYEIAAKKLTVILFVKGKRNTKSVGQSKSESGHNTDCLSSEQLFIEAANRDTIAVRGVIMHYNVV